MVHLSQYPKPIIQIGRWNDGFPQQVKRHQHDLIGVASIHAYSLVQPLKFFVCDMHMIRETDISSKILEFNKCMHTYQGDVVKYMHNMSVALEWL